MASSSGRKSGSSGSSGRGSGAASEGKPDQRDNARPRQGRRIESQEPASVRARAFSRSYAPTIRSKYSRYGENSSIFAKRHPSASFSDRVDAVSRKNAEMEAARVLDFEEARAKKEKSGDKDKRQPRANGPASPKQAAANRGMAAPISRGDVYRSASNSRYSSGSTGYASSNRSTGSSSSRAATYDSSRRAEKGRSARSSAGSSAYGSENLRRSASSSYAASSRRTAGGDIPRSASRQTGSAQYTASSAYDKRERSGRGSAVSRGNVARSNDKRTASSSARSGFSPMAMLSGVAGRFAAASRNRSEKQARKGRSVASIQRSRNLARLKPLLPVLAKAFAALAIVAGLIFGGIKLLDSSLFSVETITVVGNNYFSAEEICSMASLPNDARVFSVDKKGIELRIESNPWIEEAKVSRVFPHGLKIELSERSIAFKVKLPLDSSGSVNYWALSKDGYWLCYLGQNELSQLLQAAAPAEPVSSDQQDPASDAANTGDDAAKGDEAASDSPLDSLLSADPEYGLATGTLTSKVKRDFIDALLVDGIAATVTPVVGERCTDSGLMNCLEVINQLSDSFVSRISVLHAESVESLSFVLDNGIEIAFGSSEDANTKERVIKKLLSEHEGTISYINVRVVSNPTWRGVD